MRIIRATNAAVIPYISKFIRPSDGVDKDQYLRNLEGWLVTNPETIFLPVMFHEEQIQAFMVVYLPPQVDYAFISQIWSRQDTSAVTLLFRAMEWAEANDRIEVRLESESDHDGWAEKFGFKEITRTMSMKFGKLDTKALVETMADAKAQEQREQEIINNLLKENQDGLASSSNRSDRGNRRSSTTELTGEVAVSTNVGTEEHK